MPFQSEIRPACKRNNEIAPNGVTVIGISPPQIQVLKVPANVFEACFEQTRPVTLQIKSLPRIQQEHDTSLYVARVYVLQ